MMWENENRLWKVDSDFLNHFQTGEKKGRRSEFTPIVPVIEPVAPQGHEAVILAEESMGNIAGVLESLNILV